MILTVSNQKGGVGKTTTAANIGVLLSRQGERVLVVDTDPQFALTRQLGLEVRSLGVNLVDVLAGRASAADAIVGGVHGVDVIPGARELAGVEMSLVGELGRERFLRDSLATALEHYDHVVIDTPPNLGLLTVNALVCADMVLAPVSAEDEAIDLIAAGRLSKGHGKALLTEPDHRRRVLARRVAEAGWSVRALEAEIARGTDLRPRRAVRTPITWPPLPSCRTSSPALSAATSARDPTVMMATKWSSTRAPPTSSFGFSTQPAPSAGRRCATWHGYRTQPQRAPMPNGPNRQEISARRTCGSATAAIAFSRGSAESSGSSSWSLIAEPRSPYRWRPPCSSGTMSCSSASRRARKECPQLVDTFRVVRDPGQSDLTGTTAWYLLAADTIDERIAKLLEDKRHVVDSLTDGGEELSGTLVGQLIADYTL